MGGTSTILECGSKFFFFCYDKPSCAVDGYIVDYKLKWVKVIGCTHQLTLDNIGYQTKWLNSSAELATTT